MPLPLLNVGHRHQASYLPGTRRVCHTFRRYHGSVLQGALTTFSSTTAKTVYAGAHDADCGVDAAVTSLDDARSEVDWQHCVFYHACGMIDYVEP